MMADPLTLLVASAVDAALEKYFKATPKKRLLRTSEAAEYLGICEETVRQMEALGKLGSCRLLGARRLYDIRDLDEAIERSKK